MTVLIPLINGTITKEQASGKNHELLKIYFEKGAWSVGALIREARFSQFSNRVTESCCI